MNLGQHLEKLQRQLGLLTINTQRTGWTCGDAQFSKDQAERSKHVQQALDMCRTLYKYPGLCPTMRRKVEDLMSAIEVRGRFVATLSTGCTIA